MSPSWQQLMLCSSCQAFRGADNAVGWPEFGNHECAACPVERAACDQRTDGLIRQSAGFPPAHAQALQALRNEGLSDRFADALTDGDALFPRAVVPHAMAVPEFGTRPTCMVRHVPIGRVGRDVGLAKHKARETHPHSGLVEATTLTPFAEQKAHIVQ